MRLIPLAALTILLLMGDLACGTAPRQFADHARELIASFQSMVRKRAAAELGAWLARARSSLVASFAMGITKDEAAVTAALNLPWCNGQTEGQITKLKLVKR